MSSREGTHAGTALSSNDEGAGGSSGLRLARVIVDLSARGVDHPFTYLVPEELAGQLRPGASVEVPFGRRSLAGFVVDFPPRAEVPADRLRPILRLLDPEPLWGRELLDLAEWMRRFYGCSWRESLLAAVPAPVLARLKAPSKGRRPVRPLEGQSAPHYPAPALTQDQEKALGAIRQARASGGVVLLLGVTGSGKTEVYLQAVQETLKDGLGAVVLVPEVSLTPQAVERYRGRLGDRVGVLHYALSPRERRETWWRLRRGELPVALGTRSAVFAPVPRPGLFILDEEHESSYKQDEAPRYHARQVAFRRAQAQGAAVVLGSATPSLESYHLARQGRFALVEMPRRVGGGSLPPVECVDMRRHFRGGADRRLLSQTLADHLRDCVRSGGQAVLLLNRRGFASHVQCLECGKVPRCPRCSISLTYHRAGGALRCHYCLYRMAAPDACPACGAPRLRLAGAGTQRLEAEVAALLPGVPVARMDRDTTTRRGAHGRILEAFARGEARVLVGTRMIAKGLDYPGVTLVGVVGADADLNLPDFRAAERTFQMLSQVAGRAGRGSRPGRVVIQALDPEHPCLVAAAAHDYASFFDSELALRRQAVYPPFCRLVRVVFTADREEAAADLAGRAARFLARRRAGELVGPAPCPVAQLRGRHRWHLLLKGQRVQDLMAEVRKYLEAEPPGPGLSCFADPDPQSLM